MSSNVCQAIQVHVDLPDDDAQELDAALASLRGIAEKYPQLREGLALRALRELWPPMQHQLIDDTIQMSLTLIPENRIVHACMSAGMNPMEVGKPITGVVTLKIPPDCEVKHIEGELLCDHCAFKFPSVDTFRCMK
jgi:hypothetical protein